MLVCATVWGVATLLLLKLLCNVRMRRCWWALSAVVDVNRRDPCVNSSYPIQVPFNSLQTCSLACKRVVSISPTVRSAAADNALLLCAAVQMQTKVHHPSEQQQHGCQLLAWQLR